MKQKEDWLLNPENNLKMARSIKTSWGSWKPWGAFTNGSFKKHLDKCK